MLIPGEEAFRRLFRTATKSSYVNEEHLKTEERAGGGGNSSKPGKGILYLSSDKEQDLKLSRFVFWHCSCTLESGSNTFLPAAKGFEKILVCLFNLPSLLSARLTTEKRRP